MKSKISKPKVKHYKISTERDKAMREFQRVRVLQEATDNGFVKCWTCGKIGRVYEFDGGHGILRQFRATELEPMNCHAQCRACNRYKCGEQHKFMEHISDEYGEEEVQRLYDMDLAYQGSEDALLRLSEEDIRKVKAKRDGNYYHEQYLYWKKVHEDLRERENVQ